MLILLRTMFEVRLTKTNRQIERCKNSSSLFGGHDQINFITDHVYIYFWNYVEN